MKAPILLALMVLWGAVFLGCSTARAAPDAISEVSSEALAGNGGWVFEESIDPFTDQSSLGAVMYAREGKHVLAIGCSADKQPYLAVSWDRFIGGDEAPVTMRLDDGPVVTATWTVSDNITFQSLAGSKHFIERLMKHETFLIRATRYDYETVTAEFNLTGIEEVGQKVLEACSI